MPKNLPKIRIKKNKLLFVINFILFVILFSIIWNHLKPHSSYSKSTSPSALQEAHKLAAKKIIDECPPSQDREKCYAKKFEPVIENEGLIFAQQTLYALADFDPQERSCHVMAHEISKIATRKKIDNWKDYFYQVDMDTCGGGFMHGVLEAYIGAHPEVDISGQLITGICGTDHNKSRDRSCAHILGHLILVQEQNNIQKSLPICGQLQDPTLGEECYTGIFMEDSFKTILADHGLDSIPVRNKERMDRQTNRCHDYSGIMANACWVDLAEIFVEYYNFDPQKSYASCNLAPEETARSKCYLKAATLMAISPNYDSASAMTGICKPLESGNIEIYRQCVSFALAGLTHYSTDFTQRGVLLCSNILQSEREGCFHELSSQLKETNQQPEVRMKTCLGAPEQYMNICTGV